MVQPKPNTAQLELGVAAAHTLHAGRAHAAAAGRGLRQGAGQQGRGRGHQQQCASQKLWNASKSEVLQRQHCSD